MKTLEKSAQQKAGGNNAGAFVKKLIRNQIFIPIAALLILVIFNFVADPSFFAVTLSQNSAGYPVLSGNLITICLLYTSDAAVEG